MDFLPNNNRSHSLLGDYHPISVALTQPATAFGGPCFRLCHRPERPITIGLCVTMEVRYHNREGNLQFSIYTGVCGSVVAVKSLSTTEIEFVISNDEPTGHRYAYLLVPGVREGFTSMPLSFYLAWRELHPFLLSTHANASGHATPAVHNMPGQETENGAIPSSRYVNV